MCGRFNLTSTPGLQELLDSLGVAVQLPPPRFNIAPTENIPLLRNRAETEVELDLARWWLTPHWAKELSQKYAMFNARSEGLRKSSAFRKPFASQRGIIPMSAFIEWRGKAGEKQPWLITNEDQSIAAAALWDLWWGDEGDEPLLSCTMVTTGAAESFKPWHSRMPVMLQAEDHERWLDNGTTIPDDDPVFRPSLAQPLVLVPVGKGVGNARNKDGALMDPVGQVVTLPKG